MPGLKAVESFWNSSPCGLPENYSMVPDKKIALEKACRQRYTKQGGIIRYADFPSFKGKRVLEIGCGIGIDGMSFARCGAKYTGVDLTASGIRIAKDSFGIFGLRGQFVEANAEELPFQDNYFDHAYSFGVIHHSPQPERIAEEIYRVLKPGGTITVMLYNRSSFYYLIEVMLLRRMFFKFCGFQNFWQAIFRLFGKELYCKLECYREKLEKIKAINPHPTHSEWISMNTDDVFCPLARVYSKAEAKKLFKKFDSFRTEVWFIDKDNWFLWLVLGRFLPATLSRWLENHLGWFRMIMAEK